jgi:phosphoribosylaminoimidazolecarboxamide formyltransferase/IMP cyclohydrolase
MLADAVFAWKVCKHVKSNAIVIVKNRAAIGIGAGQMSRVDAAKLAIQRAKLHGHDPKDGISASDAFLPFSDTLEILNDAGVIALVQPGGSIKDKDVIATAEEREVRMIFTGERHFRH